MSDSETGVYEKHGNDGKKTGKRFTGTLARFTWMSVCFGINHGTLSAMIPLATSEFGAQGDWALGVLYALYTLSAVCCGTLVVAKVGYKQALLWGCLLDSMFVAGLFTGLVVGKGTTTSWIVSLTGAGMGGLASGFLWTAQGGYFTASAKLYSEESNRSLEDTTSVFSAIFATAYLSLELLMKIGSSVSLVVVCESDWDGNVLMGKCGSGASDSSASHLEYESTVITYAVFSGVSLLSSLGLLLLPDLDDPNANNEHRSLTATIRLLRTDPAVTLLGFNNVFFGLISGFLNSYVTGTVIKNTLGGDKIGYFSSMAPLVAAGIAAPLSWLNNKTGTKAYTMAIGYLGGGVVVFVFFIVNFTGDVEASLGTWPAMSAVFICAGVYRGVWEGTNKALFADHFSTDPTPAFASVILQSGLASAFSFTLSPYISSGVEEGALVVVFMMSVGGYAWFVWKYPGGRETPDNIQFPSETEEEVRLLYDS
eukprot:TRINITY_DN5974_c3_g1_i1.p1 TRINITY_DN5974_c3_g1~~TRINITY_DN5974_c3_g1_i1.p1  ORF type:complete len:514 (+),score=78.05 TRINITY_DN5974_c3_g1_i1:101-1543(+)